jgi:hypothetical protein
VREGRRECGLKRVGGRWSRGTFYVNQAAPSTPPPIQFPSLPFSLSTSPPFRPSALPQGPGVGVMLWQTSDHHLAAAVLPSFDKELKCQHLGTVERQVQLRLDEGESVIQVSVLQEGAGGERGGQRTRGELSVPLDLGSDSLWSFPSSLSLLSLPLSHSHTFTLSPSITPQVSWQDLAPPPVQPSAPDDTVCAVLTSQRVLLLRGDLQMVAQVCVRERGGGGGGGTGDDGSQAPGDTTAKLPHPPPTWRLIAAALSS